MSSPSASRNASPGTSPRRLGLWGAVVTGLGSMIGTGIFVCVVFASDLAGPQVLWAILLAAAVALANALSTAQLAALYPMEGGTYEYGYRLIGPQAGFLAGWLYICAKSAIAASAALAFAGYLLTLIDTGNRALLVMFAFILVAGLSYLVYGGLARTMKFNLGIVSTTVLTLLFFIGAGLPKVIQGGLPDQATFIPGFYPKDVNPLLIGGSKPAGEAEAPLIKSVRAARSEKELAERERDRLREEQKKLADETEPVPPAGDFELPKTGSIDLPKDEPLPEKRVLSLEERDQGNPMETSLPGGAVQTSPDPGDTFTGDASRRPDPKGSPFMLAAALMFVAFTGFGRIATLGEEVREPKRNIPLALILSIGLTSLLYLGVAAVYLVWLEPARAHLAGGSLAYLTAKNSAETAPLALIASVLPVPGASLIITVGAFTAMAGVLLNLIPSLSRMWMAMGRRRDMPEALTHLEGPQFTPRLAVIVAGTAVALLTVLGDIRLAWSFGAFTVLLYYATTTLAALRLPAEQRLVPPWVPAVGMAGCILLASSVPPLIWGVGLGILFAGIAWQAMVNPPPKEETKK